MYISCIFHVVCAPFSALATRELADAKADSSGIWALVHRGHIYSIFGLLLTGLRLLEINEIYVWNTPPKVIA